jgi:outer membrane protein assembly factor BamD (BamD/ComL family)
MAFCWRWLLILFALILSGEISFAANGAKEQSAYAAAVSAFQDEMWNRSETEFAQFVQKYPDSIHAPEAVLMQAQAEFKQRKFSDAIALLQSRKAEAGNLADQYVYWIGEAEFLNGNFAVAAATFDSLEKDFPGSTLKLRAAVESASARAQTGDWPQVEFSLENTNGVFQRAAQMDSGNDLISRGRLLLAQAKFSQNDFGAAAAVLESINQQTLAPELDWQRTYLLYQIKSATGDWNAALAATTNLTQLGKNDADLRAQSAALRAEALEKLNRPDAAIAAYQINLTNNAPEELQRQAVLKIAELSIAQNQFSNAESALQKFLTDFSNSPAADIALFTLGELHLKNYAASLPDEAATNDLQEAFAAFDHFLGAFTNSPLLGKVHLDRGWCEWLAEKYPESFADFKSAAEKLPPSEDLAVARFKMGDALFQQRNFAGALTNYSSVLDDFSDFPAIAQTLNARALYQSLRAEMELKNWNAASNTLAQIVEKYPTGDFADSSALLFGESLADSQQLSAARDLFEKFEKQFPDSPLRPQIELAVARTYKQERNWPSAVGQYESWLKNFPTNSLRAQANYSLAWAHFQAGDETNAFVLFTNFVAQFPTNEFAPQAQWWVADYYFRASDPDHFVNAERNYKFIFQNTNWQNSPLVYQAQMMAGRAAIGWGGYNDAIDLFKALVADTNSPTDLSAQARFAWGSALMSSDSPDTNNPLANFSEATNVFLQIVQLYPTNELSAPAQIEIGKCDLQLTNFDAATNVFAQVFNSTNADISTRSQAQIGFGIALEKMAALEKGQTQSGLLQLALDNYLDVFETVFGKNLRDGETADAFWVKKAGLQALLLIQSLGVAPPENFIDEMEKLLPQSKDSLEKTRATLPPQKS